MDNTLNTLLKGFAEALAPFLPAGGGEGIDVSDAVQDHIDSNFDFGDMVRDEVSDYDFESLLSDHEVLTARDFDPEDYDLITTGDFDASDYDLVTTDDVRDIVTEELRETGAAVTVDNILSTLAAALTAAAEARAA